MKEKERLGPVTTAVVVGALIIGAALMVSADWKLTVGGAMVYVSLWTMNNYLPSK